MLDVLSPIMDADLALNLDTITPTLIGSESITPINTSSTSAANHVTLSDTSLMDISSMLHGGDSELGNKNKIHNIDTHYLPAHNYHA